MEKKSKKSSKKMPGKSIKCRQSTYRVIQSKVRRSYRKTEIPRSELSTHIFFKSSRLQRTILFPKHIVPQGELEQFVIQHPGNSGVRRLIQHRKRGTNMIQKMRGAASLISKPQTQNKYT